MIDLAQEQLLTLTEASHRLPGRPSVCTLWRWRTKGVRGRVLESLALGGKIYTSVQALERFADHRGGSTPSPASRTSAQRARAIAQADRELDDAGI